MADKRPVEELSREELIALARELRKELARHGKEIERQKEEIAKRDQEIQELKRSQHRQASPFSKGKPVTNPKKPGRKQGQGAFTRRQAPPETPDHVIEAQAPPNCPGCGGALELEGFEQATTLDVPEQPKPQVTGYRVAVCRCLKCGRKVRGSAPGLAPDQYGATAHRIGARVKAAALTLYYGIGLPLRKVPLVLKELTGVSVTQSALTQAALQCAAGAAGEEYRRLREGIRERPFVHTDDTGWRVGGKTAYLMGFETDQAAVYQIRPQHRNEEVREIIPGDYTGVMVTDRGKSYDAEEFDNVEQQKCLSHILRNIQDVVETKRGWARQFGSKTKVLLQEGMALWRARKGLTEVEYTAKADKLEAELTHHLRNRILEDDDNQKLLNGLGAQNDNGNLLRFLSSPFVEPTNNRAERMLRPAVIARKVSHCSKNEAGAHAFAVFASIAQSARKAGASINASFRLLLSSGPAPSPIE
jgi:transposase